jgi:hypothetical protein
MDFSLWYTFSMFALGKKQGPDPDQFWKEYEEKIGEKILAKALGKYTQGWAEYEGPLWGLLIATSGCFRFHHFPHESWITVLARMSSGGRQPEEKTIFIPRERIDSVELHIEKRWWKKLLAPTPPLLVLQYHTETAEPGSLYAETELNAREVFAALRNLPPETPPDQG